MPRYIKTLRTHTKEKPSKMSNITFAILLFIRKNTQTGMATMTTLKSTILLLNSLDALQNGSFWHKKTYYLELVSLECEIYAQPILLSFIREYV